jgi:hypothetical protein
MRKKKYLSSNEAMKWDVLDQRMKNGQQFPLGTLARGVACESFDEAFSLNDNKKESFHSRLFQTVAPESHVEA